MHFTENYFYTPTLLEDAPRLDEKETHHAAKVLRLTQGDTILVTDGRGTLHECLLGKLLGREWPFTLGTALASPHPSDVEVELAIAVLKKPAFEAVLEWCGQLPIRRVRPFLSTRVQLSAEYLVKGRDRLQEKLTVALKQSKRTWLPELLAPVSFSSLVEDTQGAHTAALLFEKRPEGADPIPVQRLRECNKVTVIIGPEGGFTEDEVALARKNTIPILSLGESRLRAESAAFASIVKTLTIRECHETGS